MITRPNHYTRRQFLRTTGCGFGSVALVAMCAEQVAVAGNPLALKAPHFAPKVRRVIFMWMQGGPSQVDLFDYKPHLVRDNGQPLPYKFPGNRDTVGMAGTRLMGPVSPFRRQGKSGLMMTEWLPQLGKYADDLCVLNAMQADSEAHAPAARQLHTGATQLIRPSMGAWIGYGLGTENQNLPGFISICPSMSGDTGGVHLFGNAFLPAIYQGTSLGKAGEDGAKNATFRHLEDLNLPSKLQRAQVDLVQEMNRAHLQKLETDRQMEGVIESFELAFRMQSEAPDLVDLSSESKASLELYGVGEEETDNFGRQCLLARRFAEAGVRFIQITDNGWDHHRGILSGLPKRCAAVDKPIAALITDLKARGLFDDTLLVWSGEFGRTPHYQDLSDGKDKADTYGRGHNPYGFCAWIAGGGVQKGKVYGVSDDYGFKAVEQKVHIHDLHATLLHLLGLDHERLTYRYSGRDFRLTDVHGRVVKEILT